MATKTVTTIRSLWRLKPILGNYKVRLGSGITAFFLARLCEALVPLFMMQGIDRIAAGNTDLIGPVLGIFAAVTGRFTIVSYARYAVRSASLGVAFDLRERLFNGLQRQGGDFFTRYTIGDMMTRAIADISLVQRLVSMGTILLVILVFATVVGFGFMLSLSPTMTLLLLPPMPFVVFYAWWASREMGMASRAVQDRLSDLSAHVQENLSGIRTIQAMVQEEHEVERFERTNQDYADAFYRQARINSLMMAWMPTLAAFCAITIVGYGGNLVLNGEISVGTFAAFFMYLNMVVQPFRVAGFIVNLFQRAAVATDRLFEIFDMPAEIEDLHESSQSSSKPGTPAQIHGAIEIRGASHRYRGAESNAISDIDLRIEPGETVAVMGRVGSGKTTLLKQIVRLIDPQPQSIFIDGFDVRDFPLGQLRAQVAMVPQDPFLFSDALGSNITYDDPDRATEQIWQAADAADLKDTIQHFPHKLDTEVGERGVTLSGGQKQRTTLARGLIRHAPVLILDDCFSAVDTETEEHILSELRQWRSQQTTVIVSHRVSTARHANRIVVLEAGRIVEIGTHDELMAAKGFYADLERIQREGASESDYENLDAALGVPAGGGA